MLSMKTSYTERDYVFGQVMLTLRNKVGLTQGQLGEIVGISGRAVSEWETGNSYPKAERLKAFIALAVQHQAFAEGCEAEEIRALWKVAQQKVLLDEHWLSTLLHEQAHALDVAPPPVPETTNRVSRQLGERASESRNASLSWLTF
jgi:transcriptional regulator with XRE-family HTH domain